ncbi:DNA-3-methyladenine glycosylase [Nocardioides panacisoli]|uniref:DNA-3-methyladenine glycosylase n=1 Tax=Nocardioides panacisoli TaxID=627624 RepID=UPI001C62563A|nr:DNA-3-methyladenine glycosylase [Nocardioides panacisoli]QYJ05150.1 DNA-3-methyladenine glycosylase [Nocardioides panacisoli]
MPGSPDPTDLAATLAGPVAEVAPRLLGGVLRHGDVVARVVEVEAYAGADDPASHAHRGPTPRNGVMFGPPGRLYCYLSHGIHVCANVSAEADGVPAAVLLRAVTVVEGDRIVRERRGSRVAVRDLARGPGRLTEALGIGLGHDGQDLAHGLLTLAPAPAQVAFEAGPRIGVRRAADRPWRFWVPGTPVSSYRRHRGADQEW